MDVSQEGMAGLVLIEKSSRFKVQSSRSSIDAQPYLPAAWTDSPLNFAGLYGLRSKAPWELP